MRTLSRTSSGTIRGKPPSRRGLSPAGRCAPTRTHHVPADRWFRRDATLAPSRCGWGAGHRRTRPRGRRPRTPGWSRVACVPINHEGLPRSPYCLPRRLPIDVPTPPATRITWPWPCRDRLLGRTSVVSVHAQESREEVRAQRDLHSVAPASKGRATSLASTDARRTRAFAEHTVIRSDWPEAAV